MKFNNLHGLVAGLIAFVGGGAASADSATAPEMKFEMSVGGSMSTWTDSWGISAGGPYWAYNSSYSLPGASVNYNLLVDPDPILGFDFGFLNDTGEDQVFNIVVSLPVAPFAGATKIGGSIGGSITDLNEDGYASLASVGSDAIYQATIDGATWLTLFDAPYLSEVNEVGATIDLGPDADGLPGPTKDGPVVVNDLISIELTFALSAGDFANFNGIFIVQYVPAPAGALLLLGVSAFRRRRN